MKTMTPADLAKTLHATPDEVTELLENGDIAYFTFGDQVLIEVDEVRRYIDRLTNQQSLKTAAHVLAGNQVWRNLLAHDPELAEQLKASSYSPNSFGSFLQDRIDKRG